MRAWRLLLRVLPASFRLEYGEEMQAVLAARLQGAGRLARGGVWLEALADLGLTALRVHLDLLRQDLAFTGRTWRRSPGFALTAVGVAALGVAATTAAFSVADHVLFRPLPFPEPHRLVRLWQDQKSQGYARTELSPGNYRDWRGMSRSFTAMGAWSRWPFNLGGGEGVPERVDAASFTADVLPILGVAPVLGRAFSPDDDRPEAPATAILGHGLWRRRYAGQPGVVGREVLLDGVPHVVIGVMPPGFHFPARTVEVWTSLRFREEDYEDRANNYLYGVARLAPGVTVEEARAEMAVVAARLEEAFPAANASMGATVHLFRQELSPQARLLPLALLGASACVLLIACANLTHLLLARALSRRRELAIRASLGAGRERLVRQLLTESLALALAGGALGVALAAAVTPLLARLVPHVLPIGEGPALDLRVLAFALVLTTATGMAFGVFPALRASAGPGPGGLHEGVRGAAAAPRERARAALVAAEVTASVVLLVVCGLLLRALWRVQGVPPGFEAEGVLAVRTALPLPRYAPTAARARFYTQVLSEVRALPSVASAAYITSLPMVMRGGIWPVIVPGEPEDPGRRPLASLRFVTPGYFATLGIPLLLGRDVSEGDTGEAPAVAVVSRSLAERHWPGQDPLGRRFTFGLGERTVVGVVGDVRERGLEGRSEPQVYLSYRQVADGSIIGYTPKDLVVRAAGDPMALLPSIRAIVARADPEQPLSDARLLSEHVGAETAPRRVQLRVLGAFAAAALLLAGVGLHGVLAFAVGSRVQEIGVRMALGARPADVLALVLREGLVMAGAGLALGLVLAWGAGRALRSVLFGVPPGDGPTFLAAALLAALTAAAGSLLPALRAVRVDPLTAIRAD